MSSSSLPVVIHLANPGNTAPSAVMPTLPGMPHEITDHILRFTPDSVRILRAVSRTLREIGEGALEEHAQSMHRFCSGTDSSLYSLIQGRFDNFRPHYQSHPNCTYLEFHFSISQIIASLGVPCPSRILSPQEIEHCNNTHEDLNLQRIWGPLREEIMRTDPQPAEIPNADALAQQIRSWMRADASQPVLQSITFLDLSGRALTCVPLEIRFCTALRMLSLHNNQIASLSETVFQGLTSLQELSLHNNQIVSLPATVFQGLTSLQTLYLYRNQTASLPATVFQGLTSLQTLSLFSNQIASLPATVFQGLTALQTLYLSTNQIAPLPATVFQGLTSLYELYLDRNQIASLPATVFQGLTSLRALSLYGNPGLLISCNDFEEYSNNIEFLDMMRAFFNYTCQSHFAKLYQLAAGEGSPDAVRESFSGLTNNIKNAIYGMVWVEAGRPNAGDPTKWGEQHAFDNMQIFGAALKRYVRESFGDLTHVDNILRHIDIRLARQS